MSTWVEAEQSEGQESPKMAGGHHHAKIVKVIRQKGKGEDAKEMRTDKGPFMILVFANANDEEATLSVWLTEKAKWKFAKVLSRVGVDLRKMDEAGVNIDHFQSEEYASRVLVGRQAYIKVEEDGKYANAEPMHEDELPIDVLKRLRNPAPPATETAAQGQTPSPAETIDASDIPF